jgi:predicted MPP superfamily phosphohydrolase
VCADRFPPLKILHITDTHFEGDDGAKLEFLRRVALAGPYDFVFFTGDLIDCPRGLEGCFRMAEIVKGRLGSFAVLGGHDHYRAIFWKKRGLPGTGPPPPPQYRRPNPVSELIRGLKERGVEVLQDKSRVVSLGGGRRVAVVGLVDAFVYQPQYEAAWKNVPDGLPTIVLAHSPDVLPEVARRRADLAFFGHTHGGQVRFPLVGALVTHTSLPRRLAWGTFAEGRTRFVVSNGLGASPSTAYRLLCPPEAVVVELRPT